MRTTNFLNEFEKSDVIAMFVTAILITVCAVVFHQNVFNIIPLYNSLVVMLFSTKANRYAFLIGALNSILYAVVYVFFKLYSSTLYSLLFSFPMQLITFIRWGRKSYGSSTIFKSLDFKKWILISAIFAVSWISLFIMFTKMGSKYIPMDITVTISGIITTLLTMMSFYDYIYFQIVGGLASIVLYIQMLPETPGQTTYLVLSLYSFLCMIRAAVTVRSLYKEQRKTV